MGVDLNKRLIDLTAGEFLELLRIAAGRQEQPTITNQPKAGRKYVYGIAGIAEIFGCSNTTANRIKQSGDIDGAITQTDRVIITDVAKALELAGKKYKYLKK